MAATGSYIFLLPVLFNLWMAAADDIRITLIPPNPLVNESVTLNVIGVPGRILYSAWYRGDRSDANTQILRLNSDGSVIQGPKYFSEAKGFINGSLVISDLQKTFEGNYSVDVHGDTKLYQTTVYLRVYEPKDKPAADDGLSAGAIAGICIGSAAAALLIGGAIYMFLKKGSEGF